MMQIERIDVSTLVFDPVNARKHDERNIEAIKGSLAKFGQQKPIVVGEGNVVIAGNGTLEAARALGWESIDIYRTPLRGAEAMAFALADNRTSELAAWEDDILKDHLKALSDDGWDIGDIGFDPDDYGLGINDDGQNGASSTDRAKLADKFLAPPFSVLDTKQGYWQERKRAWLALGIQSELGRGGAATFGNCREWHDAENGNAQ
jgi:hypothetical protein